MDNNVFTCIGKGHGAPAIPATKKEWDEIRKAPWLKEMCSRIENGEGQLKSQLPIWTPRCAEFRNNHRAEKDAICCLNRQMLDIDEKGHTDEIMGKLQSNPNLNPNLNPDRDAKRSLSNEKYIGRFHVLMIEESVRRGTHVLVDIPTGMTPKEVQEEFGREIGIQVDPAVKNVAGCIYMVSEDHTRYVSDRFFEKEELPIGSVLQTPSDGLPVPAAPSVQPVTEIATSSRESEQLTYNGVPYSDIISKYWELFNEGKEPCEGNRNTLTFELAMVMRHICGFDRELLNKVIPDYWETQTLSAPQGGTSPIMGRVGMNQCKEEGCDPSVVTNSPHYGGDVAERQRGSEKSQCIDSALREERKGMPYRLRQVLLALKKENGVKATGGTVSTPPPMPKKLPKLIQLLTKNVPWYYRPAVSSAVFPALAAHLHGVKFRYWDNVEHEATFMNVLVGRQSIGKGSIKKPIEYIMADIQERDKIGRAREAEWKRLNPPGKTKKDPRPTDICIQMLIDNLTDAVFNQRVADVDANGERYIYTIVDEIEALKKVTSRGTIDEVMLLIRKAFDNSLHGQERVGAESVTGIAPLRWNWNASTTPPNVRKFFLKGVSDGTVGRLDIATIIAPLSSPQKGEDGSREDNDDDAPVMGIYDKTFAHELKPYLDRLEAANGLIECPQSTKLALAMRRENAEMARLYDSEAYKVFSYRANVIAWLKGMLLYIAQGYKWDKTIADFVRWTEQYNLWCKMLYFGNQLEEELREEDQIQHQSGPQNLLDLLGDEFSKEDYRQMRAAQGKRGDGDSTLRTWQSRGYIEWDEISRQYRKTEKYLKDPLRPTRGHLPL